MSKVIRIKRKPRKLQSKKRLEFYELFKEKYKIVLLIFSVLSILFGSVIYSGFSDSSLIQIIENKITLFQSKDLLKIFLFFVKTELIYFIFAMFIGTSFVGAPLIVIPISLRCIITGFLGGYMYNIYELKGVLFCLLFVFPYTAIATASLLFASNESIYMSAKNYSIITNKNTADDISVKLYLLRYLILIIINVICALFNSFLIVMFINKINLQAWYLPMDLLLMLF